MKKALVCGMSLALVLSLPACGAPKGEVAEDTNTPAVTQPMESSTPEATPTPEQTPETTQDTESVSTSQAETTPIQADTTSAEVLFTPVNETVYATTTLNVRDTYSSSGNKLGSLTLAQSVTRTGIGQGEAAGWSKIEFNGQVAYVSSDYLSTTKPQVPVSKPSSNNTTKPSTNNTSKPSTGNTSKPSSNNTSKPSSGGSSSSGQTSKPSTGGGSSSGQTSKPSTGGGSSSGGGSTTQAPAGSGSGLSGLDDWANSSGLTPHEYQGGTKEEGGWSNPNLKI